MSISFGVMTRVFRNCSLEDALVRTARVGLKKVGLLGSHEGKAPVREDMTAEEVKWLARTLNRLELEPVLMWGGAIDPADMAKHRARVERGGEIGVGTYLIMGPRSNFVKEPTAATYAWQKGERERYGEILAELSAFAKPAGVSLAIKPHGGPTGKAQGLLDMAQTPGATDIGVYYDPGNLLYYTGVAPEGDLPVVAKRLTGLCVKDHAGPLGANDFPVPGEGEVDWTSIFGTLKAAGFSGPAMVEVLPGEAPDQAEQDLVRAVAYLRKLL